MAVKIRYGGKTFTSKSEAARAMFADGKTVTEVTHLVPNMGYAFAYGVAKRAGAAMTAANRKPTKVVTIHEGRAVIRTATGIVRVDLETGKVTKGR